MKSIKVDLKAPLNSSITGLPFIFLEAVNRRRFKGVEFIEKEQDLKYQKKYSKPWKGKITTRIRIHLPPTIISVASGLTIERSGYIQIAINNF